MSQDRRPAGHAATRTGAPSGAPMDAERLDHRAWWTTVGVAYAVGVFLVVSIAITERSLAVGLIAATGSLGATIAAGRLLERDVLGRAEQATTDDGLPVGLIAIAALGGLVAVSVAQWADTVMGALAPGVAVAGIAVLFPPRLRVNAIAAGMAATFGVTAGAQQIAVGDIDLSHAANQALIVGAAAGGLAAARWFWDLVHRLEAARRLEGQLAVADERLRFAADLHDIQGHHLQVIALKSELATRLAEADPAAAAIQMAEVQQHARTALADTREVVQGYRRTPLAEELTNATRVLEAAGIDGRLEHGTLDGARTVNGSARQLLGVVVREATTNILRHSRARRARLTLDIDDGHARLGIHNDGATDTVHPPGTGLADLCRRLDAAGGTLQWQHDDGWFSLTAQIPLPDEAP